MERASVRCVPGIEPCGIAPDDRGEFGTAFARSFAIISTDISTLTLINIP